MKIKLIENGRAPVYATAGAAGLDCYARIGGVVPSIPAWSDRGFCLSIGKLVVPLGFAIDLTSPEYVLTQFEATVRPRSGLARRGIVGQLGTIDSDYRGEVSVILWNMTDEDYVVNVGDRVAQLVVSPVVRVNIQQVSELTDTVRGEGGFGSTGR